MYNEMKLTEDERVKQLKMLYNSYVMYEKSKDEIIEKQKKSPTDTSIKENLELIGTMQQDVVDKYVSLGGDVKDLVVKKKGKKKGNDRTAIIDAIKEQDARLQMKQYLLDQSKGNTEVNVEKVDSGINFEANTEVETQKNESVERLNNMISEPIEDDVDTVISSDAEPKMQNAQYDLIPIPSKGECYKHKKNKLQVSYLTAFDENLIMSPNLYKDGSFIEHMLKNKLLDDGITPGELIQGDRDAIIVWLRASGYGNMYPISVKDPDTGQVFNTEVDLSKLKFKPFKLKGDSNGFFDFTLPVSKAKVKFKFLNANDIKTLDKLKEEDSMHVKISRLKEKFNDLIEFMEDSEDFEGEWVNGLSKLRETIEKTIDEKYNMDENEAFITYDMTNRLAMSIQSINGITDRKFINSYVVNMNIKDASELRKYIANNEPGFDFNIKVKKPESLGGGYMTTFLQLDQFIFIFV